MTMTTEPYYVLVLTCLILFWGVRRHGVRLYVLLAASYIFYFEWSYTYSLLLLYTTLTNYILARVMAGLEREGARKAVLGLALGSNLGVLCLFKYYNFFVDSFVAFTGSLGIGVSIPTAHLLLPVGISFFTFQALGYVIDVYRGRLEPCRSPARFGLFVCFFPQLVAGPIERAHELLPQFSNLNRKTLAWKDFETAVLRILWGLFKKMVVADSIALQVDYYFQAQGRLGALGAVLAAVGFAVQIYCDFSAYTDIAVGTARLFGVRLSENFRSPYLSTSPREFWRRWHMTLSFWFRDYLYFPLGGSRRGPVRTYFNLIAVMLLVGLWHGANWTFILWGGLHGLALAVHRWLAGRGGAVTDEERSVLGTMVGWLLTMIVVLWGWLLFRSANLEEFVNITAGLFAPIRGELAVAHVWLLGFWVLIMMLEQIVLSGMEHSDRLDVMVNSPWLRTTAFTFLAIVDFAFFFRGPGWRQSFIYFAF